MYNHLINMDRAYRIHIRLPGHVDKGGASDVNTLLHVSYLYCSGNTTKTTNLDPKTLDVVQTINETLYIATMSELSGCDILFEDRPIGIIICWVAVDKPVQKECVDRESPI
jgi:hypothetical protein